MEILNIFKLPLDAQGMGRWATVSQVHIRMSDGTYNACSTVKGVLGHVRRVTNETHLIVSTGFDLGSVTLVIEHFYYGHLVWAKLDSVSII